MKVKVINRSEEQCTRTRSQDVVKVHRNLDPALHQFERAHEYQRAVNAAKLDRVFSRPFVAALTHEDGVCCLAKNKRRVNSLLAGSADGEIKVWDVALRRCLRRLVGHRAAVNGVAVTHDGEGAVSCSSDCTVRLWKVPYAPFEGGVVEADEDPVAEFRGKGAFTKVDHHWRDARFVTAGRVVEVWDHARAQPLQAFEWGSDTVTSVRFNPAEAELVASTGSDRSLALYDLRMGAPLRKLVMQTRSNALAWNPMEPFNFTVANEDTCLYTYDMRRLGSALCVHRDFVSAVLDVDFSPTGREFVAGAYDRSLRIFAYNGGHSREVYHTKRMQRVFAVQFSVDGSYVFSGSDDMNVRVWKAEASEQQGTLLPRERHKHAYHKALVQRYGHLPEVHRIARKRHVPKDIHKAAQLRRAMEESERRRLRNRIQHSAPGAVEVKPARKKKVVAEVE